MNGFQEWAAAAVEVFDEIKPLADRLPQDRFEVVAEEQEHHGGAAQLLLTAVAAEVGLRQVIEVRTAPQQAPTSFGLAVERRLRSLLREAGSLQGLLWDNGDASVRRAAAQAHARAPRLARVGTADGQVLDAFTAGDPSRPAVMLVPPCGMPVELSHRWLRVLGEEHFVGTWQSRGLFALDGPDADMAFGVPTQADDLLAVMDALELRSCHLMGLCGGAVIAIDALRRHPERFGSVSLWHGDYDFGASSMKTDHQRDVQALMEMGAASLGQATAYQKLMHRPAALARIPEQVAPLVLYPYASPELFHHYCRLNFAIMSYDMTDLLGDIQHPTLVVTSRTDTTAHPAGSHRVARELPHAELVEEPTGDHLSVFDTSARLTELAVGFMAVQHSTTPGHR